jgi:hypothetical protein
MCDAPRLLSVFTFFEGTTTAVGKNIVFKKNLHRL